jgi:hypothetical protein
MSRDIVPDRTHEILMTSLVQNGIYKRVKLGSIASHRHLVQAMTGSQFQTDLPKFNDLWGHLNLRATSWLSS